MNASLEEVLYTLELVVACAAAITLIFFSYRSYRSFMQARMALDVLQSEKERYQGLVKIQSGLISSMINRLGVEEAVESLQDAGYQLSKDDSDMVTHYTLYSPDGGVIQLNYREEE